MRTPKITFEGRVLIHAKNLMQTQKIEKALKEDPKNITYSIFSNNKIGVAADDQIIAKQLIELSKQNVFNRESISAFYAGKKEISTK